MTEIVDRYLRDCVAVAARNDVVVDIGNFVMLNDAQAHRRHQLYG